jgi:dihydroorotate dehydrogenase (fumarate)
MSLDLSTEYLGLRLEHPLMPGASPLADNLDAVRRLEDAGAAAIVLRSLYEEQVHHPALNRAAAFPSDGDYHFAPDRYVDHVHRVKSAVGIPVIASLNGLTPRGWLNYSRLMEDAGADAIELNAYYVAADPMESGVDVEQRVLGMVQDVTDAVSCPVAVKLTPFYSSLSAFARELNEAGAEGLVLFNRFFESHLDPEMLIAPPKLEWSTSAELALRIQWLGILSDQNDMSLAATGGVHTVEDAVTALLAGANAVQMVAALIAHGPKHLAVLRAGMAQWLQQREYGSLRDAQEAARTLRSTDPEASQRGHYLRTLQLWHQ